MNWCRILMDFVHPKIILKLIVRNGQTLVVLFGWEDTHTKHGQMTYLQRQYFTPHSSRHPNGSAVDLFEFHPDGIHITFSPDHFSVIPWSPWSYSMSCCGFIYNYIIIMSKSCGIQAHHERSTRDFVQVKKNIIDLPTSGILYSISDSELTKCFLSKFRSAKLEETKQNKTAKMLDTHYISEESMYIHNAAKNQLYRITSMYVQICINIYMYIQDTHIYIYTYVDLTHSNCVCLSKSTLPSPYRRRETDVIWPNAEAKGHDLQKLQRPPATSRRFHDWSTTRLTPLRNKGLIRLHDQGLLTIDFPW